MAREMFNPEDLVPDAPAQDGHVSMKPRFGTNHEWRKPRPERSGTSIPTAPHRTICSDELQRRLTRNRLHSLDDTLVIRQVEWASSEASSLSWMSGFPLLFFPILFEEKTTQALERILRQERILERSRKLLGPQT